MPVEFLTDDEAAAYGRYAETPSQVDLDRVFFLDDEDLKLVRRHRGDHMRAGFALPMTHPSVPSIPTTDWNDVANYMRTEYVIEKEWPGQGFAFLVDGAVGQHRLLLARNNPGWGGVDHVTLEASLGPAQQVNFLAAAQCASKLMGGVVCADGMASLRESRCLSSLSLDHLNMTIGYLAGALEGYVMMTSQDSNKY